MTLTLLPLLFGITGKRDLRGQDEVVRASLAIAFDRIDAAFPRSERVLMSSLAQGADTIAAELALARSWRVIAPLPFSPELYEEDFDEAGRGTLRTLLRDERVSSFVLEPLEAECSDGRPPVRSPPVGVPSMSDRQRVDLYEQAGLFIAERSLILIVVKPSHDLPDKIGGTARIADFRLSIDPDEVARDIAGRSLHLRSVSLLDFPHGGPVWSIDLPTENCDIPRDTVPLEIEFPEQLKSSAASLDQAIKRSLRFAARIEDFNRHAQELETTSSIPEGKTDAGYLLKNTRKSMSIVQTAMKRRTSRSIYMLASLSIAVVAALEGYAAFGIYYSILAYLCLTSIAFGLYIYARVRKWQSYAEDYRAVSEALRVQVAWWSAGLNGKSFRVDHTFLRGAGGSLGVVRSAVRYAVETAMLAGPSKVDPDGARVWIEGQIAFFERRVAEREDRLSSVESSSWYLFFSALGVVVAISTEASFSRAAEAFARLSSTLTGPPSAAGALATAIWFAVFILVAGNYPPFRVKRRLERSAGPKALQTSRPFAWAAGLISGTIVGMGLITIESAFEAHGVAQHDGGNVHHLAIAVAVLFIAVAGAMRFVSEKLSWEAELHSYDEMLVLFERAARQVHRAGEAGAVDQRIVQDLAVELGHAALAETEAWIRAHRERPLLPVVGG